MSKTTPVRWWRDDATRYHRRPPYEAAPLAEPLELHRWAFEILMPTELKTRMMENYKSFAQWTGNMAWSENASSPVEDIRRYVDQVKTQINRDNERQRTVNQLELRMMKLLTLSLVGRQVSYRGLRFAVREIGDNLMVHLVDPRWAVGDDLAEFERRIALVGGSCQEHHGEWVDPSELTL